MLEHSEIVAKSTVLEVLWTILHSATETAQINGGEKRVDTVSRFESSGDAVFAWTSTVVVVRRNEITMVIPQIVGLRAVGKELDGKVVDPTKGDGDVAAVL